MSLANQDSVWLLPGINARLAELHARSGANYLSMAGIADKLAFEFEVELTRNSIVGRCRRLGLPLRPESEYPRKNLKQVKRIRVRVEAPIEPVEAQIPPIHEGLTIYQLREGVCHWPVGELMDRPPYIYCGKMTEEGCSWCPAHFDKAHPRARAVA